MLFWVRDRHAVGSRGGGSPAVPCGFHSGLGSSGNTMSRRPAKFRTRPIAVARNLAKGALTPVAMKNRVEQRSTTLTATTTARNTSISVADFHLALWRKRIVTDR